MSARRSVACYRNPVCPGCRISLVPFASLLPHCLQPLRGALAESKLKSVVMIASTRRVPSGTFDGLSGLGECYLAWRLLRPLPRRSLLC